MFIVNDTSSIYFDCVEELPIIQNVQEQPLVETHVPQLEPAQLAEEAELR